MLSGCCSSRGNGGKVAPGGVHCTVLLDFGLGWLLLLHGWRDCVGDGAGRRGSQGNERAAGQGGDAACVLTVMCTATVLVYLLHCQCSFATMLTQPSLRLFSCASLTCTCALLPPCALPPPDQLPAAHGAWRACAGPRHRHSAAADHGVCGSAGAPAGREGAGGGGDSSSTRL